jgi:hypothetical protein
MKNRYQPIWKRGMIVFTCPVPERHGLTTGVIVATYGASAPALSTPVVRVKYSDGTGYVAANVHNFVWTGRWHKA